MSIKHILSKLVLTTTVAVVCLTTLPAQAAMLVSSSLNNSVLRYDDTTGAFIDAFVASGSGGLSHPDGLVTGPDNNLYVASNFSNSVLCYNGQTGAFIDAFVPTGSGGLEGPTGLTFGPDNNLYVSSGRFGSNSILRYNGQTGAFIDAFVPAGSGGLEAPLGLTFGPDNNLYVASIIGSNVKRYNGQTGEFIDTFVSAGSGGLVNGATGLTFGSDNDLYVSSISGRFAGKSNQNSSVLRYDGQTGAFLDAFVPANNGGLDDPSGLAFGPDNNLYVNGNFSNSVLRYSGKTGAFIDAFVPSGSGGLNRPSIGLIFSPSPVPEPPSRLSLLTFGALGAASVLKRKQKSVNSVASIK